jgi:hypothetical protein
MMQSIQESNTLKTDISRLLACLLMVAVFCGTLFCNEARAKEKAAISDVVVSNSDRDLLLYLSVDNAFLPEMEEGVLNGIPASFTFFVSLREVNDGRPGKQVVSLEFDHVLSYDPLKELFSLEFSEDNSSQSAADFQKAKGLMADVNGVKVVDLSRLKPGNEYFLSVKARLERKTLPLFFHYLIPFWKLRDYETDWHYVEFRY